VPVRSLTSRLHGRDSDAPGTAVESLGKRQPEVTRETMAKGSKRSESSGAHTYFEFEVTLEEITPAIWRRFQLSADSTFGDLHRAIQHSFGWENSHLWEFHAVNRQYDPIAGAPELYETEGPSSFQDVSEEELESQLPDNLRHLAARLQGGDSSTIRRVLAESAAEPHTDAEELLTLALTLAWSEGVGPFAPPAPDVMDESEVPDAFEMPLTSYFGSKGKKTCRYVYDMGDDWWHKVKLKRTVQSDERFRRRLLDGARACPPEDIGGVWGYESTLMALQGGPDAEKSDQLDLLEDMEDLAGWDPEAFDLEAFKRRFDE